MYSPGIEHNVARVRRVAEGIYIANWAAAANKGDLTKNGITHIVSATPLEKTWGDEFEYMLLEDCPTEDFENCSNLENAFIFGENALRFGGRVCYICDTVISHSSLFLISFLMKYKNISLLCSMQMLQTIPGKRGRKRAVAGLWPNGNIMRNLIEYESKLHTEGVLGPQLPSFYAWGQ